MYICLSLSLVLSNFALCTLKLYYCIMYVYINDYDLIDNLTLCHFKSSLFISGNIYWFETYLFSNEKSLHMKFMFSKWIVYLSQSFYLNLFVSLNLKWLSSRKNTVGSCFYVHSDDICLLTWILFSVTPYIVTGILWLRSTILKMCHIHSGFAL